MSGTGAGKLDELIKLTRELIEIQKLNQRSLDAFLQEISLEESEPDEEYDAEEPHPSVTVSDADEEVPSALSQEVQAMEVRATNDDSKIANATGVEVRGESDHFQQPTDVGGGLYTRSKLVSQPKSGGYEPATVGSARYHS